MTDPTSPARISVEPARDEDMEACYALRHAVFVAEQNVPVELERDAHDAEAAHFVARSNGRIAGTARARGVGRSVKAERVAVLPEARGHGVGRALMEVIEEWTRARGLDRVTLHAQMDAVAFYRALGYREEGDVFDEAGIPHQAMHKDLAHAPWRQRSTASAETTSVNVEPSGANGATRLTRSEKAP